MKGETIMGIALGALGLGFVALMLSRQQPTPTPAAVASPPAEAAQQEIIGVPAPVPYPTYPTPTPPPEEPFTFPEGPDFYESYAIGESWMLDYFQNVDPGPSETMTCTMEFVRYDTLRSPYSWSFTFDYVCVHDGGGTGTYRRTVNVIMGVPSIGY